MKKILHILMPLFIIFLIFSSRINAFTPQTHEDITDQAVAYLKEEGVYPCFSEDINALIRHGSGEEDNPLRTLRSWFHYSPALNSWYASATCDAITWAFVPGSYIAFIPYHSNELSNDFNWPNAVGAAGTDDGWDALGHVDH